jgi:hypothetical protein
VIQYDRDPRYAGESKYSWLKAMSLAMDAMIGFSAAPIRFLVWLALVVGGLGVVLGVRAVALTLFGSEAVSAGGLLAVLILVVGGLVLFGLAILGSYVGRAFLQAQNPPLYWLKDARNVDPEALNPGARELREVRLSGRILDASEPGRAAETTGDHKRRTRPRVLRGGNRPGGGPR